MRGASHEIFAKINMLYTIERKCKGYESPNIAEYRRSKAVPILAQIKSDLDKYALQAISGSTLQKAIVYTVNH